MTSTLTHPVFVGDFEPGSPDWHAARANGLGGSEIAAVLGLSPWESRFSLWHRKRGLASPVVETDVMYWGNRLEAVIRDEWNRRHGPHSLGPSQGEYPAALPIGTWQHRDRPWQIANPDGMIHAWADMPNPGGHWQLLEVKTARDDEGWGEEGTDEVPIYYRTQCLWYLDVFGLDVCHIAVLIGGSEYREYQVTYADDEAESMRAEARKFLDEVENGVRPDIDTHDATYQVVRELNPDIADVKFDVPAGIAVPYLDAFEAFKRAEGEKKRTAAVLMDAMGTARRAIWDGDQIAMRIPGRDGNPPSLRATPTKPTGLKVSTT